MNQVTEDRSELDTYLQSVLAWVENGTISRRAATRDVRARLAAEIKAGRMSAGVASRTSTAFQNQLVRKASGHQAWLWVFAIWNGLMALWLGSGLVAAADAPPCYTEACEAGAAIGTAIGVGFILFVALAVNGIMAAIYFVSRPR